MSRQNKERLTLINEIIEEYQEGGYVLTLRQLYYQLVSRDVVPNQTKEYSKLSTLLKEGRMAGIVDWDAIEDRLRKPSVPSGWNGPADIIDSAVASYAKKRMNGQSSYLEVWVEKDALSGVLSRVTEKYHVPIMVNRGYSSASAMYDAYNRFKWATEAKGQDVTILYLGDFDPSGLDMINDIRGRILEFASADFPDMDDFDFTIEPLALTRSQINVYNPPPNPAKITDSRFAKFSAEHGDTSWEVDALKPEVLHKLVEDAIIYRIDIDQYNYLMKSGMRFAPIF